MISTKKKKKARKGIRDSWGTIGQGKLIILNRVFRKGFTKKHIPKGGEGKGPTDKKDKEHFSWGEENVKTSSGKCVWFTLRRV